MASELPGTRFVQLIVGPTVTKESVKEAKLENPPKCGIPRYLKIWKIV